MFHETLSGSALHAPSRYQVVNDTGSTVTAGKVVSASSIGSLPVPSIVLGSLGTIVGIVEADIANGQSGFITSYGVLIDFNTNAWTVGTTLYSDSSGNLTTTLTGNPIAQVFKQDSSNGVLYLQPFTSGGSVTGTPTQVAYFNSSSLVSSDPDFTRTQNSTKDFQLSSYFQGSGATQNNGEVFITDNPQSTNPVTLVFNGTTDTGASVVNAWNIANPLNTITQVATTGGVVTPAQTVTLASGKSTIFNGNYNTPFGTVDGSGFFITDNNTVANVALESFGDNTQVTGTSGVSKISGVLSGGGLINSLILQIPGLMQISAQNAGTGHNAFLNLDSNQGLISLGFNSVAFLLNESINTIGWTDSTNTYFLPTGTLPTSGQVVGVTSISGNDVTLGFVTAASGSLPTGTQYNQILRWNEGTAAPEWANFFIQMADQTNAGPNGNIWMGYQAGGVVNDSAAASYGPGYANTVIGTIAAQNASGLSTFDRNTIIGEAAGSGSLSSAERWTAIGYQAENTGANAAITDVVQLGADNVIGGVTSSAIISVGTQNQVNANRTINVGNYNNINYLGTNAELIVIGNSINVGGTTAPTQSIIIGDSLAMSAFTAGSGNFIAGFGGPGSFNTANHSFIFNAGNNLLSSDYNFVIGYGALQNATAQTNSFIWGQTAASTMTSGYQNFIAGYNADTINASNNDAIVIGAQAKAGSIATALGNGSYAHDSSIALGYLAQTSQNYEFVAGSNSMPMSDVYFGTGKISNGPWTLHGSESLLPSPAPDTPGGALTILAGRGNGAAYGGVLSLGSSFNGTSGNTQNNAFSAIVFDPSIGLLSFGDPTISLTHIPTLRVLYGNATMEVHDGTFGDSWTRWDTANRTVGVGDVDFDWTGTLITVNDSTQTITNKTSGVFQVTDNAGNRFLDIDNTSPPHVTASIGDIDSIGNGTVINIMDSGQSIIMTAYDEIYIKTPNIFMTGTVTLYNNVGTAGIGVPAIYAGSTYTGQTGDIATTVVYTAGTQDEILEVGVYALTLSAATLGTQSFLFSYQTDIGAKTVTVSTLDLTLAGNDTPTPPITIMAKSGSPVSFSSTHGGVSGSYNYNVSYYVKRIL